jgi:hypothetical protein
MSQDLDRDLDVDGGIMLKFVAKEWLDLTGSGYYPMTKIF